MAFPKGARGNMPMFTNTVKMDNECDNDYFSLMLTKNMEEGSKLILCGIDSAYTTEDFTFHNMLDTIWYTVNISSFGIEGFTDFPGNGMTAMFDSGTSGMALIPEMYQAVMKAFKTKVPKFNTENGIFPCENMKDLPNIIINIDGVNYVIPSDAYSLENEGKCSNQI